MAKTIAPEKRSHIMSCIRCKDTKPEMIIRRLIFGLGYRYRLHKKGLPGKPDIVFVSRKKIIFVHGCFWHNHNCAVGRNLPKTNQDYWIPKLEGNKKRDKKNRKKLKDMGWDTLVIWECQLKDISSIEMKIIDFLEQH